MEVTLLILGCLLMTALPISSQSCQNRVGSSGQISIDDMGKNETCLWIFNTSKIYLIFDLIDSEENCITHLTVSNSTSLTTDCQTINLVEWKIDGKEFPFVVAFLGPANSTLNVTRTGIDCGKFHVKYDAACNVLVNHGFGSFKSPYYFTEATPSSFECNYAFDLASSTHPDPSVAMTFAGLEVNSKGSSLEILDNAGKMLLDRKDQFNRSYDILSGGPMMTMKFTLSTHLIDDKQGFRVEYVTADSMCTEYVNMTGITTEYNISLPKYGVESYPNNLRCRIIAYTMDMNARFLIRFYDFELADDFDRITIVDGAAKSMPSLGTWSMEAPKDIFLLTSSHHAMGEFVSDESGAGRGFLIGVTVQVLGGLFIAPKDEFSLHYGRMELPTPKSSNDEFYFQIHVAPGQQIFTVLLNVSMHPLAELTFYDGLNPTNQVIAHFRSDTPHHFVFSSSNTLLIVAKGFYSDSNSTTQNFTLFYEAVNSSGSLVNSFDTNGGFELRDADPEYAIWQIHSSHMEEVLLLRIHEVFIPPTAEVRLYEHHSAQMNPVAVFNQSQFNLPPIFLYPVSRLDYIRNATAPRDVPPQYLVHHPYIRAHYESFPSWRGDIVFNLTATSEYQVLSSPLYPDRYPWNAVVINPIFQGEASEADKVTIFFGYRLLQLAPGHFVDVILAKKNETTNATNNERVLRVERDNLPDDLILETHHPVAVVFSSRIDGSTNVEVGAGFQVGFVLLKCGKNITDSSEPITTPTDLSQNVTCIWIVTIPQHPAQDNTSVNIISYQFQIDNYSPDLNNTKLVIKEGASDRDHNVNLTLKNGASSQMLSKFNKLWIMYNHVVPLKADEIAPPPGFSFSLTFNQYACDKSHQCNNGICMHDDWKCNYVDNCGDGSDELHCGAPSQAAYGAPGWLIAVVIIAAFALGIFSTLLIPRLYRRCKNRDYDSLRDVINPVET